MDRRQLQSCLKDVKSLHAEFWSIPNNAAELSEQVSGCSVKNRYRYVLPNPQSRVKLPVTTNSSDLASGYINANYIRVKDSKVEVWQNELKKKKMLTESLFVVNVAYFRLKMETHALT